MLYHLVSCDITRNKNLLGLFLSLHFPEKIYWSWTSSLKPWITRRLSRRRPMKSQGFLVRFIHLSCSLWQKKCDWPQSQHSPWAPTTHVALCVLLLWGSIFNLWTHFHNLMLLQGKRVWSDENLGLDGHVLQFCADYFERYGIRSDSRGNCFMRHCSLAVTAHIC